MMKISVAAIIVMTTTAAHSETADEKLCVMLSAQKVPSIPGLIVTAVASPDIQNQE